MPRPKKIATCDCETDPFLHMRIPVPFLWGFYDGKDFLTFEKTEDFVAHVINRNLILYAHNGGKFDFMYLLPFVGQTKAQIISGRIVSMMLGNCELRDSYSAVPEALKNIKKKEIDMAKLEKKVRRKHWGEIMEYLEGDCVYLFELMEGYRQRAGKRKTIASNALAFSKKLSIDPGKTSYLFDSTYRPYYFGGRTECFQPGTHKDIDIIDIKSSYPYAMLHDHASGDLKEFHGRSDLETLSRAEIERSFITLECDAEGCFPLRGKLDQGLMFPHGRHEFKVTGWEYIAAIDLKLIENVKVISVHYSEKTINFKEYVEYWYKEKLSHSSKNPDGTRADPINYTIDKIMMNALYGKLSQDISNYHDYKIMPGGSQICENYKPKGTTNVCRECGERDNDHGWKHTLDFGKHEIHSRPSLWRYKYQFGVEWQGKRIYNNVATGASITGFARAYLLRAIHAIGHENVIYCDTDSVIFKHGADTSSLRISDEIGAWEFEDHRAVLGHFNGKKLYGIHTSKKDKDGKPVYKLASKGAKLTFEDMGKLAQGETITWQSPSPSYSVTSARIPYGKDGGAIDPARLFVVRNIRSTSHLRS